MYASCVESRAGTHFCTGRAQRFELPRQKATGQLKEVDQNAVASLPGIGAVFISDVLMRA